MYFKTSSVRNVTKSTKKWVVDRQENRCAGCGDLLECTRQVDHVVPLWCGGSNAGSNLQALCPNCHSRKSYVEMKAIPRGFAGSARPSDRKCPMCAHIVSAYFPHPCKKFEIVQPGSFKLYPMKRKEGVLDSFRFDTT